MRSAYARSPSLVNDRSCETKGLLAFRSKHPTRGGGDWSQGEAVECSPDRVSGTWTFRNTRVPVPALFETLEGGVTVEDFLTWFPGVRHEQIDEVLVHAARSLLPA